MLAKYLEKWPEIVAGKKCIELGAGCGLAGGHFMHGPSISCFIILLVLWDRVVLMFIRWTGLKWLLFLICPFLVGY